nr:M23 family metallopeptidase [Bacteroidota bacterium]
MQNSTTIKIGDKVKRGQPLAKIGVSGSSFFPHLHFEMRNSITGAAEGLPSYFSSLKILNGTQRIRMKSGLPETGAIYYNK